MKLFTLRLTKWVLIFILPLSLSAQAPEKMSYQSVIRDANNALVTNQSIGMQISILAGSVSGSSVYTETHTALSNANGLVTIEIGDGAVISGSFNTIDWANGPFFVKTEVDPLGGANYTITGVSQLLSVPYALHAKTADALQLDTNKHYIGEIFGGGVVFWVDSNVYHGLIAHIRDTMAAWQTSLSIVGAQSSWDGAYNTSLMTNSPAADYVNSLTTGGFTDWYLPSLFELQLLFNNRYSLNKSLSNIPGSVLVPWGSFTNSTGTGLYWSSSEADPTWEPNGARIMNFSSPSGGTANKSNMFGVRAIRSF